MEVFSVMELPGVTSNHHRVVESFVRNLVKLKPVKWNFPLEKLAKVKKLANLSTLQK